MASHGGSPRHRHEKMMRKAEALGMETRNVSQSYLMPVLAGSSKSASETKHGVGHYHETINLSPKALSTLRTTRMLQSLGQKVIFSNDPYVNSAFESLITTRVGASGLPPGVGPEIVELVARKAPPGRLRPRGSKAAALQRAKRLVGMGAHVTAEVPFVDALRVCDLERDRSALPALLRAYVFNKPRIATLKLEEHIEAMAQLRPGPQLQAAALLMQGGYFFTAIKVVYGNYEALRAVLVELADVVAQHMDDQDWEAAAALWNWKDPDRELFLKQFKDLQIIAYYMDARKQLRALKEQGVVALSRVEREMLLKVVQDFSAQLEEEFEVHQAALAREDEERARAKLKVDAEARAAAEVAIRRAEEAAKALAKVRAKEDAKARREAEARAKAAEAERHREEVRLRAEQAKLQKKSGPSAASKARARPVEYAAMSDAAAQMLQQEREAQIQQQPDAEASTASGARDQEEEEEAEAEAPQREEGLAGSRAASDASGPAGPGPESSEAIIAAESADKVAELGLTPSGTPRGGSSSNRGSAGGGGASSRPGSSGGTGSRPGSSGGTGSRPGSSGSGAASSSAAAQHQAQEAPHGAEGQEEGAAAAAGPDSQAEAPAAAAPGDGAASGSGGDQEELAKGIDELKRVMSASRQRSSEVAEQLRRLSVAGSRPTTPSVRLNITLMAGGNTDERLKQLEDALEAERAVFQQRLAEERAALANVLLEEKAKLEASLGQQKKLFDEERQRLLQDLYEQQGKDIDIEQQISASAQSIEALKAQRDQLRSAGGSRNTSARTGLAAEEAARLEAAVKLLEKKLDDELSHVRQLEDEKSRVETERTALEQARLTLEAQKSQAELGKAKAEQEKGALQEQIAKTMRMFQEQLAQTVKMAAMLQAQRILGAATGGAVPMGHGGGMPMPGGMAQMNQMNQMGPTLGSPMASMASMTMGMNPMAMMAGGGGMPVPMTPMMGGGAAGMVPPPSPGAAAAAAMMPPGIAPAVPHEVDEPPTKDEVVEYGKYLGIDVVEDADLLYIAEWALTAPLPEGWTVHLDGEGNEFFYNAATNQSTYEHPMDEHYRMYYRKLKEEKQLAKMSDVHAAETAAGGH